MSDYLDKDRLDAIAQRLERVVPGPWTLVYLKKMLHALAPTSDEALKTTVFSAGRAEDAEFLAAAPEDIQFLLGRCHHLIDEVVALRASLDLHHRADMRGIALWRSRDPEARDLSWPDQGQLVAFLLEDLERARAETVRLDTIRSAAEAYLRAQDKFGDDPGLQDEYRDDLKEALGHTEGYAFPRSIERGDDACTEEQQS